MILGSGDSSDVPGRYIKEGFVIVSNEFTWGDLTPSMTVSDGTYLFHYAWAEVSRLQRTLATAWHARPVAEKLCVCAPARIVL